MVVAVEAWPTVSTVALEVWPLKLVSPEYCSVIELAPIRQCLVVTLPEPLVSVAVPSEVVPLKNWTVPVGVLRLGYGLYRCGEGDRLTEDRSGGRRR